MVSQSRHRGRDGNKTEPERKEPKQNPHF